MASNGQAPVKSAPHWAWWAILGGLLLCNIILLMPKNWPEDRHNYNQEYLLAPLAVMLGGCVSEEAVNERYKYVQKLLGEDRRRHLDNLAQYSLKEETVDCDELVRILGARPESQGSQKLPQMDMAPGDGDNELDELSRRRISSQEDV